MQQRDLKAAVSELAGKLHEADVLRERMGNLLTGVANALKGDPGPLVLHDWSDLPAHAARVCAERDQLAGTLQKIREACAEHHGCGNRVWPGRRPGRDPVS